MRSSRSCCICSQILGRPTDDLITKLLQDTSYIRRVALETKLFAVVPSLGPLVRGHTILCPKDHYRSFAGLPRTYDDEFIQTKEHLTQVLQELYHAPVHYFEHGTDKKGSRILCTVEHAHLHFVPADVSVLQVIQRELQWTSVRPNLDDLRAIVGEDEYLLYEAPDGQRLVVNSTKAGIESQYMRRVFADALGKGALWNWRDFPFAEEANNTYEDIEDHLRYRVFS